MTCERISRATLHVAAAAGLVLLSACGGGGGGAATPSATAAPCTTGTNATLTLVTPPNGGSGVGVTPSGQTSSITVNATSAVPGTIDIELVNTTGGQSTQTFAITGTYPNYTTAGYVYVVGQKYTVYFTNTAQNACSGVAIGSFST